MEGFGTDDCAFILDTLNQASADTFPAELGRNRDVHDMPVDCAPAVFDAGADKPDNASAEFGDEEGSRVVEECVHEALLVPRICEVFLFHSRDFRNILHLGSSYYDSVRHLFTPVFCYAAFALRRVPQSENSDMHISRNEK